MKNIAIIGAVAVAAAAIVLLKPSKKFAPAAKDAAQAEAAPQAKGIQPQAKALPRLVDLGAGKCVPCKAMKPILKDVDHEPLASDPDMPRWRNSAQWARNTMRQEGLLKDDSPHGTWEISEVGRARITEGSPA